MWVSQIPGLAPDRFGNWEPVAERFDLSAAVHAWKWPFLARRRAPPVSATVFMRHGAEPQHSTISLKFELDDTREPDLVSALPGFVKALAVTVNADFGLLHLMSESEVERALRSGTARIIDRRRRTADFHLTTRDLRRFIPDLYWGSLLGRPYVERFGREHLLQTPATAVEELENGSIWLQLTQKISDVAMHPENFNRVRDVAKLHLDKNSFFDPELHPQTRDFSGRSPAEVTQKEEAWYRMHEYSLPQFVFEGNEES